jgi:hypothetical protein
LPRISLQQRFGHATDFSNPPDFIVGSLLLLSAFARFDGDSPATREILNTMPDFCAEANWRPKV